MLVIFYIDYSGELVVIIHNENIKEYVCNTRHLLEYLLMSPCPGTAVNRG